MRPIKVTTETAIPTVFQVELAEAAEARAEEVAEGEVVGFQVISDTVEPFDSDTVGVAIGVDKTTADLRDEVWVRMGVDGEVDVTIDEVEELVVVGLSGGDRISPRVGKEGLVVVIV